MRTGYLVFIVWSFSSRNILFVSLVVLGIEEEEDIDIKHLNNNSI